MHRPNESLKLELMIPQLNKDIHCIHVQVFHYKRSIEDGEIGIKYSDK